MQRDDDFLKKSNDDLIIKNNPPADDQKDEDPLSQSILLNNEGLARHFLFVVPDFKKGVLFSLTNYYNTFKNRKGGPVQAKPEMVDKAELAGSDYAENTSPPKKNQKPIDMVIEGVILGVIPETNMMDSIHALADKAKKEIRTPDGKIVERKCKLYVISITDDFELGYKVTPLEHEANGVGHHFMPMTDFGGGGTTAEAVLAAVYRMRQIILNGDVCYVHCKAGRARSAMVVATYLAIYHKSDMIKYIENNAPKIFQPQNLEDVSPLQLATTYLKLMRPQVNLHTEKVPNDEWINLDDPDLRTIKGIGKLEKASEALTLHQKIIEMGADPLPIDLFNKIIKNNTQVPCGESALSTLEFKNHLVHMTAFKQLKIAAIKAGGKRLKYMQDLCEEILLAQNDNWFENRNLNSAISNLYTNSKTTAEMKDCLDTFLRNVKLYKNELSHSNKEGKGTGLITETDEMKFFTKLLLQHERNLHAISTKSSLYGFVGLSRKLEESRKQFSDTYKSFIQNPTADLLEKVNTELEAFVKRLNNRIEEARPKAPKEFMDHFDGLDEHMKIFKMELDKYYINYTLASEKQTQPRRPSVGMFEGAPLNDSKGKEPDSKNPVRKPSK